MTPFMYGVTARIGGVAFALWMAYEVGSSLLRLAAAAGPAMAG